MPSFKGLCYSVALSIEVKCSVLLSSSSVQFCVVMWPVKCCLGAKLRDTRKYGKKEPFVVMLGFLGELLYSIETLVNKLFLIKEMKILPKTIWKKEEKLLLKPTTKNPAYGRHQLS